MLTKQQIRRLRVMIKEGLPVAHISREIGCGRTRVYREKRSMHMDVRKGNPERREVRTSRPTDPQVALQERFRKIEIEGRLQRLKVRAEEAANRAEASEGERDGLIAFATQCGAALDALPSLSVSDAGRVCKDLEARHERATRGMSARIDMDRRLAALRGQAGQLQRQVDELDLDRLREEEELRALNLRISEKEHVLSGLEAAIAARQKTFGLQGDIARLRQLRDMTWAQVQTARGILADREKLITLERVRAFNEWHQEMATYPMDETAQRALAATVLRRR